MDQIFVPKGILKPNQPLRIILIGLPYCGLQQVATLIQNKFDCKIFKAYKKDNIQNLSIKKYIRQICYKQYKETTKAIILIDVYEESVFNQLKKRNYLNVVQIQSNFKNRYQRFLKSKELPDKFQHLQQFMEIDAAFQTQQFIKCLQFTRVKIINNSESLLESQIIKKQHEIIRFFRPSWDQYFMKIADIARRRSNCMKTSVGAVIVNDDNRVISTGFNGTPKGIQSCYKFGCERCNKNEGKQLDQCLCLHAEQSAIIEVGISKTKGCRLYTTYYPCFSCAKIIKQAGIKKIYYIDEYEKQDSGKQFIEQHFSPDCVIKIGVDNLYY